MKKILTWLFNLFDTRTDFEKAEDKKIDQRIIRLRQTYHIRVGARGSISVIKKSAAELKKDADTKNGL